MTPERLYKSYRIATQNQKWLPYGYLKSKIAPKWLPNNVAIWELKGSQMVAIFKIASYFLSAKILFAFAIVFHFLLKSISLIPSNQLEIFL